MTLLNALLADESGAILSAEAALVGTLGVMGATVGLSTAAQSVDEELADVAYAFRSLDQSFSIPEQRQGGAWKAGSQFTQTPADESIEKLKKELEEKRPAITD